ncbi:MAG: metallophosphoesterase [Candidatus Riflebacteria bacterium]|nr:metallophosphoesterase [Candidatus Riflebacteria bacterium]
MICNQKALSFFIVLIFLVLLSSSASYAQQINPFELKNDVDLSKSASNVGSGSGILYFEKKNEADNDTCTIAIMSDLHIRDENYEMFMSAVKAINSLPNIYAVAITGDLCKKIGSKNEYTTLIQALSRFSVPILAVPGNHDVRYRDHFGKNNKKLVAGPAEKKSKLERFRKALKLRSLRYTRKAGGHLLVFLPDDELKEKLLVQVSDGTLEFLRQTLKENRDLPTIVFCHAPLKGSYEKERGLTIPHATAQPAGKIHDILQNNPQVFLWVAGHLHMSPSTKDYFSPVNKVGKVTVIHIPSVQPKSSWVHTIKLSPEKAVVRTYNPKTKKYVKKFDRVFQHKPTKQASTQSGNSTPAPQTPNIASNQSGSSTSATEQTSTVSGNQSGSSVTTPAGQQPQSSGVSTVVSTTVEVIKDLIKAINKLLNGLWTGLMKILKI